MCFYKEDKLLAKRAFSKYMRARNPESAQTEQAPTQKPEVKDPELEDFLQRKKQALEETKPQQHLELPGLVIPPHHTSTEVSDNSDRNLDSPVESVVQPNYFISPNMMASVVPNLAVQNANNLLTNIALQNLLLQRTQISSPPVNMFHNFHNVNIPTSINFPANIIKPTFEQPRPCFDETLNQEIFQMISHNANVINQLIEAQEQTEAKMQHCIVELRKINEEMVPMQEECPLQVARIQEARLEAERHNNNPTPATLFRHLFGAKNYKYELVLTNTIQTPLLKDKNVVLKIQLIDSISGEIVHNTNKIHLQVLLQTWEIPSTNITRNKNGNKAVTGQTETDLKDGQARLDRVQISEVTSKFMNGYVAMVVVPKQPSNHGTYIVDDDEQENFINFEDVKPLMLEKIVVKSKKKPYL